MDSKAKDQRAVHDKMVHQADDYLAEIDKALGENTWDDPELRGRGRLGTTRTAERHLSS